MGTERAMNKKLEYYIEDPRIESDSIETIEREEFVKLQKRLRLICYLFQYLIPTLFATILLLR